MVQHLSSGKNVALIPARIGSKRLPKKNIKILNGHPLVAYTIAPALKSGVFEEVIVSTDSEEVAEIAKIYGAQVPKLRPEEFSSDTSSDLEWMEHALREMVSTPQKEIKSIAILRPTNPLRSVESIKLGLKILLESEWADSVRAMQITDKHPGKMWKLQENGHAEPYLSQSDEIIPTHNRPTQTLEKLWIQNASLEFVKLSAFLRTRSISGFNVLGIELPEFEGTDINNKYDWEFLEYLVNKYPNLLSQI